jgi:hypothetical protein
MSLSTYPGANLHSLTAISVLLLGISAADPQLHVVLPLMLFLNRKTIFDLTIALMDTFFPLCLLFLCGSE